MKDYKTRRAVYRAKHKEEIKAYGIEYYNKHKEERKAYAIAYTARHREKARVYQKTYWAKPVTKARIYSRDTGIEYEEALAWFLIPEENRRCWLCKEAGEKLHLDHDHANLRIRGWTHSLCNNAEGMVRKSPNPNNLIWEIARIQGIVIETIGQKL